MSVTENVWENITMVFEDLDDVLVPLMPGSAEPDGERYLSLAQCVAKRGRDEQTWRNRWLGVWGKFFPNTSGTGSSDATDGIATAVDSASDEPKTPTSPELTMRVRLLFLKKMMFGHLSDEHFGAFVELCRIRNLDPWSKQVVPKVQPSRDDPKKLEVILIVTIEGFRLQADRTGLYAGNDEATFEYDQAGRLTKASTTVWKLVGGERRPFTGVAYWDEYRPLNADPHSLCDRMPHVWLAKCSEAAAIRKGFPKETGGLYTPEEMEQAFTSRNSEGQQTQQRPPRAPAFASPDAPATFDVFCSEMDKLGYGGDELVSLIAEYRRKKPLLADANPRAFWAAILKDLRERKSQVA